MNRNILELTKRNSPSSQPTADQSNTYNALQRTSTYEVQGAVNGNSRMPTASHSLQVQNTRATRIEGRGSRLPIIDSRTGREIELEDHNFATVQKPIQAGAKDIPPTAPKMSSQKVSSRKPIPIINPKTGEVVTQQPVTANSRIPIVNPKTGKELVAFPKAPPPRSSFFPNNNIVKEPFPVLVTRAQKKKIPDSHPSFSSQTSISTNSPCNVASPLPTNSFGYRSSTSINETSNFRPHQNPHHHHPNHNPHYHDMGDDEEEEDVDKYEWTGLPRFGKVGLSIFDEEESLLVPHHEVTVW